MWESQNMPNRWMWSTQSFGVQSLDEIYLKYRDSVTCAFSGVHLFIEKTKSLIEIGSTIESFSRRFSGKFNIVKIWSNKTPIKLSIRLFMLINKFVFLVLLLIKSSLFTEVRYKCTKYHKNYKKTENKKYISNLLHKIWFDAHII